MDDNIDEMPEMKDPEIGNEVFLVDTLKLLTETGFSNLCGVYGSVKNVLFLKKSKENHAYVEFEKEDSVYKMLNHKNELPSFVSIELSNKTMKHIAMNDKSCELSEVNEDLENKFVESSTNILKSADESSLIEGVTRQSIYFGPNVNVDDMIKKSKELRLIGNINKLYNLENDDLFGRPLNTKWEKMKEPEFSLNDLDFYYRFQDSLSGKIKVEKKLSLNAFSGWISYFNDGENVLDVLKNMSKDINCCDLLNLDDLKHGTLVGAYDDDSELYARGYVTLVSKNSVNVALCDFGRVIVATKIRELPKKLTQIPAYALKVYSKNNNVSKLTKQSYSFMVLSVSAERVVLTMILDDSTEFKVQLKKWQPTVEEYGVPYVDFKSGTSVELLKFKKMNSAIIRSKEMYHMDLFFSTWNSVASYCLQNPQPLKREPNYGEIIGFKSTISDNYVRGKIHKYLGNNIYTVKQMDDPLKENVNSSEMIELLYEHKSLPINFLKVELNNALPYPIQFEAKRLIDLMIARNFKVHFNETDNYGWKYVDLVISLVGESLNTLLYSLVEPLWLKDNIQIDREYSGNYCTYSDLLHNNLKENSVVVMTFVMYDDGTFYMRDQSFDKHFILMSKMIKEYCSVSLHPYLPHIDEVCLGKFSDGMWYRVICDQLRPGELAKVHSVDLGTIALLGSRNLKRLPLELMFHPVHAYLCYLDNSKLGSSIDASKMELLLKKEDTDDVEFKVLKNLGGKNQYLINCSFLENILM